MRSRARVAAFAAGFIVTFAGCHTVPPPPPPPPPVPPPVTAQCTAVAVITYVAADPQFPLRVSHKQLPAKYPTQNPSTQAVCWFLDYGDGPYPFDEMKLEGVESVQGQQGQSVLKGDLNFRGQNRVKAIFNDEPNWPAGSDPSVTVVYAVVGRLKGSTQNLAVDPEVIIQR